MHYWISIIAINSLQFTISYPTLTITLDLTISYAIIWIRKVLKFRTLHCGWVRNSGLYGEVLGLVPIFSDVHHNSNALFHSWWNSNSLYCDSMYASITILGGTQILCNVGTHGIASFIYALIFNTVIALLHKYWYQPSDKSLLFHIQP